MVTLAFECPRCEYKVDAATAAESDESVQPKAGDLSVCLRCAAPLQFEENMVPRWLTHDEFWKLPPDHRSQILRVIVAIVTRRPSGVTAVPWKE